MNERDLFIEALQRTDPAERAAYIEHVRAGDAALRRRIELLLEADKASEILKETVPPDSASAIATEFASGADPASTLPFAGDPAKPRGPRRKSPRRRPGQHAAAR